MAGGDEKKDHLAALRKSTHNSDDKDHLGCVARHETSYDSETWPDCNYRKNAENWSKSNEQYIYNVPSFRTPESWIRLTYRWVEPLLFSASNKDKAGQVRMETPLSPIAEETRHCWDFDHTIDDQGYNPKGETNYQGMLMPFWNNAHHIIACDEIYQAFEPDELEILVLAKYNINRHDNVILLPNQESVAYTMQLPAHCPDVCNHDEYSEKLRSKLAGIKSDFQEDAEEDDHKLTENNAPGLVEDLDGCSKELRKFLIDTGTRDPGVRLDDIALP